MDDTIIRIFAKEMRLSPASIDRQTDLGRAFKRRDIEYVKAIVAVEEALQVSIKDEDAAKFRTLGDLIDHVQMLKGE